MQYKVLVFLKILKKCFLDFCREMAIFGVPMLRFARHLRLTDYHEGIRIHRFVLPLRDRMFRYAQSLLLVGRGGVMWSTTC